MQKLYVFSFLLLFSLPLFVCAQHSSSVSGTVTDLKSKTPLEFVNVVLRSQLDNAVKGHEVSGSNGSYSFKGIPEGSYYIQASYIGYDDTKTVLFTVSNQHVKQNIVLDNSKSTLKEVTINSKKAIYVNSIDKKVYHVDQDIMAKSGSASEVLQNVPLVQVDIDGNVSLRNSAVTILVNGKISPLMGKNAAAVLQQLPANSIEKIEVITNPSAKYKPDGTGGIINIILKKDAKRGLNGTQ
ncbi:carboxypeptidase-like regulatory domain-containing protein [Pedobacter sp. NJ-S-72]